MSIFLTADLHLDHKNIIEYEKRPFKNIEEMNNIIISNINKIVKSKDDLYILGDFAFCNGLRANELLKQINTEKKYLVKGNHDTFLKYKNFDSSLFVWVKDYYKLKYNKQKIILSHYPFQSWDSSFHDSKHCHGHNHSRLLGYDLKNRINVGVDVNNFYPVSLDKILENK